MAIDSDGHAMAYIFWYVWHGMTMLISKKVRTVNGLPRWPGIKPSLSETESERKAIYPHPP